jgi:hypothetical protein
VDVAGVEPDSVDRLVEGGDQGQGVVVDDLALAETSLR